MQQALQKVVDAFTALTNVSAGIINGLEPLFDAIGAGIEEFQNLDSATQKSVGELLGIAKAIDTVLPLLGGLAGGLQSVGSGLTALAGAQGFKALLGNLGELEKMGKVGKGGLIGFALAGGYAIGEIINETIIKPLEEKFGNSIGGWLYEQFNKDELEKIAKAMAPVSEAQQKLIQDTQDLRDMNASLAEKLGKTEVATKDTQRAWQDYANELVNAAKKHGPLNDALGDTSEKLNRSANAVERLQGEAQKNGDALGNVSRTTKELAENNETLILGYDKATGKVNSWSGGVIKSGKAMDDNAKKTEKAIQKSEDFYLQMEKMASNERITNIRASVDLEIAEAEANAKRVEAMLESISTTFGASTKLTGDLFGMLINDADNFREKWALSDQIKNENRLRDDQMKRQKELTEAEIGYMKEKTRQLRNGDAKLTINAAGLEPHLEAIWFQILDKLQAKVNAEGEEMLLGLKGN
ncbi:MAG: hypothetical protein VX393_03570 [Pseudomonadota bacterium]|nr:hypothetical protein [Pseudomonadota bacterium]